MAIWPVSEWVNGDERSRQAQVGAALHLLARLIDIVDVEHADPPQPSGSSAAEVRDPGVVRPTEGGQKLAVGQAIPEQALARLQARAPDTIHPQLLEHCMGVIGRLADVLPHAEEVDRSGILEAPTRLDHRAHGPDPRALEVPGVVLLSGPGTMPFHAGRASAELRLDPALVEVRRFDDVGIGRDDVVVAYTVPSRRGGGDCHIA